MMPRRPKDGGKGGHVYVLSFVPSSAAYARLGRALVEHGAKLLDSFRVCDRDVEVMVRVHPDEIGAFILAVKPYQWRYESGTVFDNGTLFPLYASPEDETADRKTTAALRVLAAGGMETA